MIDNTKVIDNFLPDEQFKDLKNYMKSGLFPWYFSEAVEYAIDLNGNPESEADLKLMNVPTTQEELDWSFYSTHTIYKDNTIKTFDIVWQKIKPVVDKLEVKSLIRIKANMYPKTLKVLHHKNHVDGDFKHKGAIFYLNTCDGLTVLSDGTEVESVANRMLLFDSSQPHHSTTTTDQNRRMNINFNYF